MRDISGHILEPPEVGVFGMATRNVLLIEDDLDIAKLLRLHLEDLNCTVTVCHDGQDGLTRAMDNSAWSLLVLDLTLPNVDGLEICRRVRLSTTYPPILMLTAKDMLSDKAAGFEAGADDYLIKPFSLLELGLRLRALARRPAAITHQRNDGPHYIIIADLKFDLDTLEAERAQQAVKLNPTTRRLLAILMQNSHRVVTREELEQSVWGSDVPAGDVLRAHMHALRGAIDKGFETKLLHTVHGTGYRLYVAEGDNQGTPT